MSKSKIFIAITISFAAGVWLASRFNIGNNYLLMVAAAAVVAFAFAYDLPKKWPALAAVFLFALVLGGLRLNSSLEENQFQGMFGEKRQLEGFIVEDVDIRQSFQFLTVRPYGHSQKILVTAPLTASYFYGDSIVLNGKVEQPENFDDFDYRKYLERRNVYAVMKSPKIWVLKSHQQNFFKEQLLNIKWAFTSRVGSLLPEPQSSLLMGILIGARKTLPQNIIDNFNATGTSHIVAISGFNITIIITNLGFLAYALGRKAKSWAAAGLIVALVVLAGASASVVRAAIMGGLLLFAANLGRQYSVGPALFFAGLVMLVINPRILFWDASFQLSFLATLGIVYGMPPLERLTENWPNIFRLKEMLLTTMCAIVATLPLILFLFGRLSAVAPLVNILILPIIPLTMLLGFLSFVPVVGAGCAFAAGLLLRYILGITEAFAHIPYSSFTLKISQYSFALLAALVLGAYFVLRKIAARKVVGQNIVK